MTTVLAALLLPLTGCMSLAQTGAGPTGQIDGAVLDSMLHPIPHATVTLVELGVTDETSDLGGFTFRGVPVGSYTLAATPNGTKGTVHPITVTTDHISRVILQVAHVEGPQPRLLANPADVHLHYPNRGQVVIALDRIEFPQQERPDDIDVRAEWSASLSPSKVSDLPRLAIELLDDSGELVGQATGQGTAHIRPDLNHMSEGTRMVWLRIRVVDTFVPQPDVPVSLNLELYYGTTYAKMYGMAG